jgi:hypothetical protein
MPVVHTADAYAVEQLTIEQIELGDWIVIAQPNGEPRYWQVQAKRFNYAAGEHRGSRSKVNPSRARRT